MEALWISQGERIEVTIEGPDADGDYEATPSGGDVDEYSDWTVYRSELESGIVRLEIECYNCGNPVSIGQRHNCPAFEGEES